MIDQLKLSIDDMVNNAIFHPIKEPYEDLIICSRYMRGLIHRYHPIDQLKVINYFNDKVMEYYPVLELMR